VPTANILTDNELIPTQGVYATFLEFEKKKYNSVTNIGVRPTFGGSYLSIESNLIDTEIDLYGKNVRLHFVQRMRDEKKFDSVLLLRGQIQKDIDKAMKILSESK
jgi:riboflavin kinase/FMN adenylyltransferase